VRPSVPRHFREHLLPVASHKNTINLVSREDHEARASYDRRSQDSKAGDDNDTHIVILVCSGSDYEHEHRQLQLRMLQPDFYHSLPHIRHVHAAVLGEHVPQDQHNEQYQYLRL
jgi:hypothetical protein